jgi:uncharacterized UPF0160 family protein
MKLMGTHSGNFHADDVYAIAALTLIYPEYKITRSRDENELKKCDFLVDVGGVYDHENKIYDHHFANGPAYDDGLKMSSIGLVWKHYGPEICGSEIISERVCDKFIRTLDAHDNGITLTQSAPNSYNVGDISISSLINVMNPPDLKDVNLIFEKEVVKAKEVILAYIAREQHWVNCKTHVTEALQKAHAQGLKYIEVGENISWVEHLLNLDVKGEILFVLYPSDGKWYSRTVPVELNSFASRKDFPKEWAGLRDEEFSKISGVKDGVFCHHSCFIMGTKSRESTEKLIQKALKY